MKPQLSILVANYNHSEFIGRKIQSLLDQSFQPYEIIVVDDGSTDNSVSVIESLSKKCPTVHLYRNETNRGVIYTDNRALQMARGDYIMFSSADDLILPGFLEKLMHLLLQYPMAGLCCADPATMDGLTGHVEENSLGISSKPTYISPQRLWELLKKKYSAIGGHTTIVRKSAVIEAGNMIPELKWYADWFLYYVIGFRYGICYVPEPLALYRVSPNSYSARIDHLKMEKRETVMHLLQLLHTTPFQDVLPFFRNSGVLSTFGGVVLSTVRTHPEFRGILTPTMIRRCLSLEFRKKVLPFTPRLVLNLYRRLRQNREKDAVTL